MSFYFDSDDEDGDNKAFLCPNCGSTQSYADESGHLFCSLCFSQSQTQPNEAELDFDEVQALVARGRGGQLIAVSYAGAKRQRRTKRLPNETYDTSKPLPSLQECLLAYTTVIQACLKCATNLLELNESQSIAIEMAVRQTWLAYLQSWQEGAEFYQKYHPEVRISLRDSFLNRPGYKNILFRFLKNQAVERIEKEGTQESDNGESDGEDMTSDEFDQQDCLPDQGGPKAFATLSCLLKLYKRKGPKDAALRLSPNMSTVASLLLTALCKLGVSAPHVAKWISTGEIPLLNPYKVVLNEEMQSKMEAIAYAFRLDRVPTTELLEFQTKLLLIAAGQPPKLITPASIALLTARLVSDLNLEQRILNMALAMLGEKTESTEEWVPVSLEGLNDVKSRADILAAIAVACKLNHSLELRKYGWDHGSIVPWNDEQVLDVRKPSAYVDFVNTHVLAGRPMKHDRDQPNFLLIKEQTTQFQGKRKRSPVPSMAGEPNPRQPYMKRLQKYHEWRARLKKRKATWADANGVSHFMVYALTSRHEHLHPHYQVLLETMSLVADVKASSIHRRVCLLDREIHYLCRPWDEPQDQKLRAREKRRKAVRMKMAIDGDATTKVESDLDSPEDSDSSSSESDLSQALI